MSLNLSTNNRYSFASYVLITREEKTLGNKLQIKTEAKWKTKHARRPTANICQRYC